MMMLIFIDGGNSFSPYPSTMSSRNFPLAKIESMLHTAIELDQIILLEAELANQGTPKQLAGRLENIKRVAGKNAELLQKIRSLVSLRSTQRPSRKRRTKSS